jgi:hypothetical protein
MHPLSYLQPVRRSAEKPPSKIYQLTQSNAVLGATWCVLLGPIGPIRHFPGRNGLTDIKVSPDNFDSGNQ